MARLYKFYYYYLMQLSLRVALVYECTKLLEKAFGVIFGFEEIVRLIYALESTHKGKYGWMVQKTIYHSWGFTYHP